MDPDYDNTSSLPFASSFSAFWHLSRFLHFSWLPDVSSVHTGHCTLAWQKLHVLSSTLHLFQKGAASTSDSHSSVDHWFLAKPQSGAIWITEDTESWIIAAAEQRMHFLDFSVVSLHLSHRAKKQIRKCRDQMVNGPNWLISTQMQLLSISQHLSSLFLNWFN